MTSKHKRKRSTPNVAAARTPDVLDVHGAAALLTVSADTVYDLLAKGQLPGRKVGRKWITTKAALVRWIEAGAATDTLGRAVEGGDIAALTKGMNEGKIRLKS